MANVSASNSSKTDKDSMKEKFKEWFGLNQPEEIEPMDINHAAAALMVEIMAADNHWDDVEAARIKELLNSQLGVTEAEADEILLEASDKQKKAHDLYQFTSVINEHYNSDQKYQLLKQLWLVAYADGEVDRYEEHMIRRLGELLHLAHSRFIQAKIDARSMIDS